MHSTVPDVPNGGFTAELGLTGTWRGQQEGQTFQEGHDADRQEEEEAGHMGEQHKQRQEMGRVVVMETELRQLHRALKSQEGELDTVHRP